MGNPANPFLEKSVVKNYRRSRLSSKFKVQSAVFTTSTRPPRPRDKNHLLMQPPGNIPCSGRKPHDPFAKFRGLLAENNPQSNSSTPATQPPAQENLPQKSALSLRSRTTLRLSKKHLPTLPINWITLKVVSLTPPKRHLVPKRLALARSKLSPPWKNRP